MKKYLVAGFIMLLPIALTLMILNWLFDFFTTPFLVIIEPLIKQYENSHGKLLAHHDLIVLFITRIMILLFLCILAFILGFAGHKLFHGTMGKLFAPLFSRVPFVKGIYKMSKELTKAFFSPGEKTFKRTVLIPFPNTDTHAVAFVTGDAPLPCRFAVKDAEVSLFVPTAPHPISGYMLIASKKSIKEVDVSVEDAFKFLVSCGVFHPGEGDNQDKPKLKN